MASACDGVLRTFAWVSSTGGRLSAAERRRIRRAIALGYVDAGKGLLSWPLRGAIAPRPFPDPPDSRLAKTAEEAAAEQGPALAGHGYRTWLLGAALAEHDRIKVDPELFYVTSLLHDAGILRAVVGEDFTKRSGELLIDVVRRAGADPDIGQRAADAAVAHATPGLRPADDPVGFLVQWGAMADLAGLRLWDLPRGYVRRAYEAYPAAGVHGEVPRLIRGEARAVPEGRFAVLRRSGLDVTVTLSPTRLFAQRRPT